MKQDKDQHKFYNQINNTIRILTEEYRYDRVTTEIILTIAIVTR